MRLRRRAFIKGVIISLGLLFFSAKADTLAIYQKTKLMEGLSADKIAEIDKIFTEIQALQASADVNKSYLKAYSIFIRSKLVSGQFEAAKTHLYKALAYAEEIGDVRNQGIFFSNLGVAYINMGKTDTAVANFEKAAAIFTRINDKKLMASTEQNLGGILLNLNQYQKGLLYCKKAYAHFLAIDDSLSAHYALLNCGVALKKTEKLDSALIIFSECNRFALKKEDPELNFAVSSNLADVYIALHEFEKAENYLEKMLELANRYQSKVKKAITYMGLSTVYEAKNDAILQKQAIDSAIFYNENVQEKFRAKDLYLKAANIYEKQGDFVKANRYLRIHLEVFSALNENNMQQKILEYEAKFNSKAQQAELAAQEQKITEQRLWIVASVAFALVLSFLFIIITYRNKLQLKLVHKQNELNKAQAILIGEENERERTAKELHDAVCSSIAAVSLQLVHVNRLVPDTTKELITPVVAELQQISTDVRNISHNLHIGRAEDFVFNELVQNYLNRLNQSQGIQFYYNSSVSELILKDNYHLGINLFRILQELINNAIKHSKASMVHLQVHLHEAKLVLSYEDNGVGYNANDIKEGLGFNNIKQRTDLFKGHLNMESSAKGSSFSFSFEI